MQNVKQANRPAAASPYANQPITKLPNWEGLTAFDIWFNNLSIGTFLVASIGALLSPANFQALTMYAYPLALVLLIIDLLLLVSDLGDPLRFHHMLRVFKLSSPMSFGTWSLSAYGILLGVASVVAVLHWPLFGFAQTFLSNLGVWNFVQIIGALAAIVAILPALGGILYKGELFSITSQDGWKDARWFGAYIANSAILLGACLVMLIAFVAGQSAAENILRWAMLALLVLDAILLWLVYANVDAAFRARFDKPARIFFVAMVVGGGIAIPFLLLLVGSWLGWIAALLILAVGLVARYAFVQLPRSKENLRASNLHRVDSKQM